MRQKITVRKKLGKCNQSGIFNAILKELQDWDSFRG